MLVGVEQYVCSLDHLEFQNLVRRFDSLLEIGYHRFEQTADVGTMGWQQTQTYLFASGFDRQLFVVEALVKFAQKRA